MLIAKQRLLLVMLGSLFLFSSCFNERKLAYFQKHSGLSDTILMAQVQVAKIQTGDILSIYVNSLSPDASVFFNPLVSANSGNDAGSNALSQSAAPGYLVDESGNITLPLIGIIPLSGLTIEQAKLNIKKKLGYYLKEPTVNVRFLNYKISIIGEVNKPGVYIIPNDKISIPEAIAIAGDLTAFGKSSELEIIRETNNRKEFIKIDLTDRSVFSSPYLYLHSNDIVYVKASKAKVIQNNLFLRIAPIVISLGSLIVLILTK